MAARGLALSSAIPDLVTTLPELAMLPEPFDRLRPGSSTLRGAVTLGRPYEVRELPVSHRRGTPEVALPRAAATPPPDLVSRVLRADGRDVVLRYVERGAPW